MVALTCPRIDDGERVPNRQNMPLWISHAARFRTYALPLIKRKIGNSGYIIAQPASHSESFCNYRDPVKLVPAEI